MWVYKKKWKKKKTLFIMLNVLNFSLVSECFWIKNHSASNVCNWVNINELSKLTVANNLNSSKIMSYIFIFKIEI